MKQQIIYSALFFALLVVCMTSCRKIAGLGLQTDTDHETSTLDPHIHKTAWQFLKERSVLKQPDTVFKRMYDAIIYSGIDTAEYTKAGRTFIFLHNDAVFRAAQATATDTYWGRYKVNNAVAKSWTQYTPQQVKNWLLYLIVQDEYSYDNLGSENVELKTLLPEGADAANPRSVMYLKLSNDRDSRVRVNDFINSVRVTVGRTSGILSDNGPIHVVDRVVEYGVKP
ncbi:fasciclin domain-containing protein [Longitalea luteola]|uniref:fasciclin domain-containing protein n=1 Tax=Longitalea luteola TaxID=2812563 RepID=UPI001A97502C|nr:fasciclin domain-containing protein [Longitalea luteola]